MAKRYIITPQGELREIETTPDSQALAQAMAIFNESRRTDAEVLTQAAVRGLHQADTAYKLAGQQRENLMEQLRYTLGQSELIRDDIKHGKDIDNIHRYFNLIQDIFKGLRKSEEKK